MKNFLSGTGHALAALGLSVLGIALSPAVSGVLPPKVALALTIAGIAYQGFTGKALTIAGSDPTPAPVVAPAPVTTVVQPAPAPVVVGAAPAVVNH